MKAISKRIILIVIMVALLIVGLAAVFVYRANHYNNRFLPNTKINNYNCGNMTVDSLLPIIEKNLAGYKLEVDLDREESIYEINGTDIDLTYEKLNEALIKILNTQNKYQWFRWQLNDGYDYKLDMNITYSESKLNDVIALLTDALKVYQKEQEPAKLSAYDAINHSFTIIPGKNGTKLASESVASSVKNAINQLDDRLVLSYDNCFEEVYIPENDIAVQKQADLANLYMSSSIKYNWNGNQVVVDYNQIHNWLQTDEVPVAINEELVRNFVNSNAELYDTFNKDMEFTNIHGDVITLQRKSFGWKTDVDQETEELINLITAGTTCEREPVYSKKGRVEGTEDLGNTYFEADLTNQHVYLIKNSEVIFESDCVSGSLSRSNGAITPSGVFGIENLGRNVILRGADYEDFVYYWMGFYGNYGMHDATWRDAFGGDIYITDGSHGCINLPKESADVIYPYMKSGFPIVIYYTVDPYVLKANLGN